MERKDHQCICNEQTGQQEIFTKFDPDAKELLKGLIRRN